MIEVAEKNSRERRRQAVVPERLFRRSDDDLSASVAGGTQNMRATVAEMRSAITDDMIFFIRQSHP